MLFFLRVFHAMIVSARENDFRHVFLLKGFTIEQTFDRMKGRNDAMDRLYVIGEIRRILDVMDDRQINAAYRWMVQQVSKTRTSGGFCDGHGRR